MHIIHKWADTLVDSDRANIAKQSQVALGDYYIINACIGMMKVYITKRKCRKWFSDTYKGFGAIINGLATNTTSVPEANNYMIYAYKHYVECCGLPN